MANLTSMINFYAIDPQLFKSAYTNFEKTLLNLGLPESCRILRKFDVYDR